MVLVWCHGRGDGAATGPSMVQGSRYGAMVVLVWCHGAGMVMVLQQTIVEERVWCHGPYMVQWSSYGAMVVLIWCCGPSMVP